MDAAAQMPVDPHVAEAAGRRRGSIERLLHEIDVLIDDDEAADRALARGWRSFDEINAAAHLHAWDAYSIDLSVDAASYRTLNRGQQRALKRVFGTIYRAESVVDDWMDKIVAAIPREAEHEHASDGLGYDALRTALTRQEHDEKMHRGSLLRVASEVFGVATGDVDRIAKQYNNFVAEALFARFEEQMRHLLRPGRPLDDVYTAIFVYGILSEDVVANGDVVIRRAKGNSLYDTYNLPGMKEGQTHVRKDEGRHVRIAVLATRKFLDEHEGAAARLLSVCGEYVDLADRMLRQAKSSHGLIDAHLAESYGPDVDSLYYYLMNMKRLAARLDELRLRAGVREVKRRVDAAVTEFTDDDGAPITEAPNLLLRTVSPTLLKLRGAISSPRRSSPGASH